MNEPLPRPLPELISPRRRRCRREAPRSLTVVPHQPRPPLSNWPPPSAPEPPPQRDSSSDAWLALAVFVLLLQPVVLVGLAIAMGLYVMLRIESVVGDELDRH